MTEYYKKWIKTKIGVVNTSYQNQRGNSKRREHPMPTYTWKELFAWANNDWLFNLLYENWKNCGCNKMMKPSFDRIDDSKPYALDNIQIMTWAENKAKGHRDTRTGLITHGVNPQKKVIQTTLNGVFVNEFISGRDASRATGVTAINISRVCNGKQKTASGFKWRFE